MKNGATLLIFHSPRFLLAAGFVACLASLPLSCAVGSLRLSFSDVAAVLCNLITGSPLPEQASVLTPQETTQILDKQTLYLIVAQLRLPRVVLAFLNGAGLAVAGTVFQAILRNPLADPFTLGVSGGAAFGASLAISLGLSGAVYGFGVPLMAFGGAGTALFAVLVLGRIGGGFKRETLVLAGVVVSAFLAALIALVKALDEASVAGIVFWLMGSFQGRGLRDLLLSAPGCFVGGLLALLLSRELDILALGDKTALSLGLSASAIRLILLLAAGGITASCVAISGIIGFIGLIVPHLCRMLLGSGHRRLLPASALTGGLLLLWSDAAARTILPGGVELPVGIITALLGGPFFCFILSKKEGSPETASVSIHKGQNSPANLESLSHAYTDPERGLRFLKKTPLWAGPTYEEPHLWCKGLSFVYGKERDRLSLQNTQDGEEAEKQSPLQLANAVLQDISFSVDYGDCVGLLGPNGSGKSTLIQCLAGLLRAWQGTVYIQGTAIGSLSEKRRALLAAVLLQKPEAIPSLTALHLVLLGRYAHSPFLGSYSLEDRRLSLAALEEAGSLHLADRPANRLSGGELQRVLLARCLAQSSPLLLLDEATSGLDPACCGAVFNALLHRNQERRLTVFAAMHDLNLAARYCRRLIFLKQGRIVADGPTQDVFTAHILHEVYACDFTIIPHPDTGVPQALARR